MKKQAVIRKPDSRFSNKVTVLSFVMAIFVICIHANNLKYYGLESATQSLDYILVKILADVIGGMAVPFFFMMSGYWFYRGVDLNSQTPWRDIANKERKKIRSLVVPYLLWNAFGMVFYMVLTRIPVLASAMNSGGEAIPITLTNVIKGIFAHEYYFTFWYMQDLIIITFVIAPLFFLLLRNKTLALVVTVILLTLSVLKINLSFVNTSSILCFTVGGGITYWREWIEKRKNSRILGWLWLILLICCVVRFFDLPIISDVCLYASPFLLLNAADVFEFKNVKWFQKQSFFIYAAHVIPVTIIGHLLAWISGNQLWAAVAYLLAVIITVCLIYIVSKILSRVTPRFYRLICGGR